MQLTNHFAPDFYFNKLFWRTIQNQRKGVVYRLKHAVYMTNDMTDDKNTKINSRSHKVMKWPTLTLAPSLLSRWQSVLPAVRVERGAGALRINFVAGAGSKFRLDLSNTLGVHSGRRRDLLVRKKKFNIGCAWDGTAASDNNKLSVRLVLKIESSTLWNITSVSNK